MLQRNSRQTLCFNGVCRFTVLEGTPFMKSTYYGWRIVFACALMMALIMSPVLTVSGVFIIPVSESLNISRSTFSAHISIATISCMFAYLCIGRLLNKFSIRRLLLFSAGIVGLCFICYALASKAWHFYLSSAVAGFFTSITGNATVSVLMRNWFPDSMRGRAIGLSMAGSGAGSMTLIPLMSSLITRFGWRLAYCVHASLIFIFLLPVLSMVRDTPTDSYKALINEDIISVNAEFEKTGMSVAAARRTKSFWFFMVSTILMGFTSLLLNTSGYSYFCSIGISPGIASLYMSAAAGILIGAKIAVGWVSDKIGAKPTGLVVCTLMAMSYCSAVFAVKASIFSLFTVILFGMGNTVTTVCISLITADLFGTKDLGAIVGLLNISSYAGQSLSTVFANTIFDRYGTYVPALFAASIASVLMLLLLALAYHVNGTKSV